jgi:hypothetical protein
VCNLPCNPNACMPARTKKRLMSKASEGGKRKTEQGKQGTVILLLGRLSGRHY